MAAPDTSEAVLGYTGERQSSPSKSLRARFARDVVVFGWANVVSLLLNGTLTFFLPRFLPIEDFGYYRLFVLYASLAGMLHLGFLEGILVRWAERPAERVAPEIRDTLVFLVVQHLAILLPACAALLIWFRAPQHLWLGLGLAVFVLLYNCSIVAQIALQARKQFRELSFYTVVTAGLLLLSVGGWKAIGQLHASTAIVSYIFANAVAGVGLWRIALRPGSAPLREFRSIGKFGGDNLQLGWKILAANLLLTIIPTLDRFFVSGTFSIQDFAIYAFAGNALAVVYTVALSVARVVYPYLSEGTNGDSRRRAYNLGQATLFALWAGSLLVYFPTALLVHWILPKYVASLPIARLLMINSGFVCMIHILHANYFRVNLALNRFLSGSLIGLAAAAMSLFIARHTGNLQYIAAAMTGAIVVWWMANEILLAPRVGTAWADRIRIVVLWSLASGAFLGACTLPGVLVGALVYSGALALLLIVGLRTPIKTLYRSMVRVSAAP